MKITKKILQPARHVDMQIAMQCDLCGAKSPTNDSWTDEPFQVCETEVSFKIGSNYPEGGSVEEWKYDVCPNCFKNKIMPLFGDSNEFKKEWDW